MSKVVFNMAKSLVLIIDFFYKIFITVLHWFFAITSWSQGKKVPPIKNPILKMSATELAEQIRSGTLTSECVVRAFIERMLEVESIINATVERRFTEAMNEAREADALIASNTFSVQQLAKEKPLLGVPFTVKMLLTVKGMRSTAGSLLFKDVRAQEDAPSVAMMKQAGAIVLATTNSPEMGANFETNNFLHGTTCNPYDTSRTSGGSSGGESAIIAAGGSVIGLGNDLAGSVRVPAMFSGIFSHKPSRGLVSNAGSFPTAVGKGLDLLYTGPMCRYAKDLETTMKVLALDKQIALKFNEEVDFSNVKIYYIKSFPKMNLVFEVDKEIQDAVFKVASYFVKKHGSESQETVIPLFKRSNAIYIHNLIPATHKNFMGFLTGRKPDINASVEALKFIGRQSDFTVGPIMAMNCINIPFLYNSDKVEHFEKLGNELRDQLNSLLGERSVLILPTFPFQAPYHHEMPLLVPSTCYTNIFNTLGLPVSQCPVGLNSQGLPIGVQLVGAQENDALTIACAKELEKAFGGWIPPTK